jgi:PAS domain S-box-containing protein
MRNSLRKAVIEEQARNVEEKELEWTSQGINLFNRVLRVDNQNLQELSYEVIKVLTLYMGAHMGGIYLCTSNANELELISFIGFSKEKYKKKYIQSTEGIVGRCMVEKEAIFINDVPEEFEKISSGLGSSLPKAVLVVPLISNQQLVGVLEIESIKEIFKYQIAFVERIAETIASTIAAVKTNVRTTELLDKAKKQAEELEQQEEEMRQNMEEMQATQEDASKRESELMALIKGFEKILPIIVYDLKGKITDINENYLKIFKGRKAQFMGKQHKADLFMNESEQQKQNAFWEQINNGFVQESVEYIKSGKDEYWLKEKFIPVRDRFGIITKVLCIGFDITDLKKTESKIQQIQEGVITKKTIDLEDGVKTKANVIDINLTLNHIDLTYLKMVYKKDPAKIYNILKLYFDTLPGQIREVEQLAKNREFDKLKSKTNSLKTKMSYMGLKPIYENLREIEKLLAEQKNLNDINGLIKKIISYWSLAHLELKKLLRIPG